MDSVLGHDSTLLCVCEFLTRKDAIMFSNTSRTIHDALSKNNAYWRGIYRNDGYITKRPFADFRKRVGACVMRNRIRDLMTDKNTIRQQHTKSLANKDDLNHMITLAAIELCELRRRLEVEQTHVDNLHVYMASIDNAVQHVKTQFQWTINRYKKRKRDGQQKKPRVLPSFITHIVE